MLMAGFVEREIKNRTYTHTHHTHIKECSQQTNSNFS